MEFFNEAPISRNPDRKDFLGFFPVNIRCVAEEVAQWKGFEEITEKLFTLAENVLQESLAMYDTHVNGFQVFNLADIWINNLMFRLDDDSLEPQDVILVREVFNKHWFIVYDRRIVFLVRLSIGILRFTSNRYQLLFIWVNE